MTMLEKREFDHACHTMVRYYGSWVAAFDVTRRMQRENTAGVSRYHWNKMLDAFERSRTIG